MERSATSIWPVVGLLGIVALVGEMTMPARHIYLDQSAWHEEARAIILTGALAVDDSVGRATKWAYVVNHGDGHYYSKYGLFNSLLHLPPLALELAITGELPHETSSKVSPTRLFIINIYFVLLSIGIAFLLWLVSGWYIESRWKRAVFVLMTLYCTSLWYYLRFPLSESTQVALFLLFWLFFVRLNRGLVLSETSREHRPDLAENGPAHFADLGTSPNFTGRPRRDAYWAWFALLLLCQTRVADLFIVPLFGSYLAWLAWRSTLPGSDKVKFVPTTAALPAVLIVVEQGFVHYIKFGSPFLSGYHQFWERPNPHTVWQVIDEFAFHPQWSFFITFPVLILAVPGWWPYLRRHRAEALFLLALTLGMFVIVEPLPFWRGEWSYGPRYFLYLLPVLSMPALYVLRRIRGAWMAPVIVVGLLLAAAQFQVQRIGFFDWRNAFRIAAGANAANGNQAVKDYFNLTPVPKICWDHLRCRDHLEDLPYYPELARTKAPDELEMWKREVLSHITVSNLYWFPDANR